MTKLTWLTGITLLPLASAAGAQSQVVAPGSVPPVAGVTDRPRVGYDPIGGRVGSFFLYPRLDLTAQRTDNLRATEVNKISDTTFEVLPSADLVSTWSRNYLGLRAFYAKSFHAKTDSEDFSRYGGSAASRLDFGRDTHLFLNANATQAVEPRTDINSLNATRSPIRYSDLGLSGTLTSTFNRLTVSGTARINRQKFDDAETLAGLPIDLGFRDNRIVSGSLEGRYLLGASTSVIASVGRTSIRYTDDATTGFNRNSAAYNAQVGVGLRVTSLIQGDVRVGYFRSDNKDPRFLDSSGVAFSANVVYNVTPTTTIRLLADRSSEAGGSTVTTGNVRSTGAITVEHELLRNLILTGYGRYASIDPQGLPGHATELEGRLAATYYLSRRFRFNAGYSHYQRRGSVFGRLNVNSASLGVALTL